VFEQDIDFASEAMPKLLECYRQLGRSQELIPLLEKAVEDHAGVSVTLALANLVEARDGLSQARALVLRQLRRHPSMKGLSAGRFPVGQCRGGACQGEPGAAATVGR
jgi:lipopolysaccharide biosynthesis regulator YciM